MAAPNIRGATGTINGKVAGLAVTNSALDLVANAASSNKLLKVNTIIIANVDTAAADEVLVTAYLDYWPQVADFSMRAPDALIQMMEDRFPCQAN